MNLPEGMIKLDSDFAKEIGFTSADFSSFSYLWGNPKENLIWISMIVSKKRGAFRRMMEKIEQKNIIFRVPTPLGRMQSIGLKNKWNVKTDGEVCYFTNEK